MSTWKYNDDPVDPQEEHHQYELSLYYQTEEDVQRDEVRWAGLNQKDEAWILSDRDVWYRNPHYVGPEEPHPEI